MFNIGIFTLWMIEWHLGERGGVGLDSRGLASCEKGGCILINVNVSLG